VCSGVSVFLNYLCIPFPTIILIIESTVYFKAACLKAVCIYFWLIQVEMEDTTPEDDKEAEMKEGDDGKEEDSQDGDEVRPLAESSSSNPGKPVS
jgi:hypothetical protein